MTQRIGNPFPFFQDRQGLPLDGGDVYIGVAGSDPETSPVNCFWDFALTQPILQPVKCLGGLLVNGSTPAHVYVSEANYSIRARDADGDESFYTASAVVAGSTFQPLDSDLTAIAALATTPFGRNLLTLADSAALQAAVGAAASLPLTGAVPMTGTIIRSGAGAHGYYVDPTLTSGRRFVTAAGAADPTSLPGDLWLKKR